MKQIPQSLQLPFISSIVVTVVVVVAAAAAIAVSDLVVLAVIWLTCRGFLGWYVVSVGGTFRINLVVVRTRFPLPGYYCHHRDRVTTTTRSSSW